jgi:hypothetical protein
MDTIKSIVVCYNHTLYGMYVENFSNEEYKNINFNSLNPERIHWFQLDFKDGKSRVMVLNEFMWFLKENNLINK